ncbi:Uma2 family endonuclease, partial [Sulfurovum sp. bin170]|nr:Uma2 family endonuclease [Sulfurovum sp. bin170]
MESLKLDEFTFEDYYQISENDRCELIFGEIVMMASPSYLH